jgi:putative SOS response-associated peptidase YedK
MDYNARVLEQELRKPWKIKQDTMYQQSFLAAANGYNYGVKLPAVTIQDQAIELMEWSLYPGMPPDIAKKVRNGTYNCRSEEATQKKSFKGPINKGQFCLIPSSWILEFHTIPKKITGDKKDLKIPFRITNKEGFFAIPGLWNPYKNEQGEIVRSFTMLTKHGGEVFSKIHNAPRFSRDCRQVVMFGREYWDAWLDDKFLWDDRLELIEEGVIKDEELVFHPVRHPNKIRNINIPEMKEDYREYEGIDKIQYPELLDSFPNTL